MTTINLHAEHVRYQLKTMHLARHRVVVWTDPPWPDCPKCGGQNIPTGRPFTVDSAIEVGSNMQHGECGAYIPPPWEATGDNPSPADIADVEARVRAQWETERARAVARVGAALKRELHAALDRLDDGDEPDDVTTGSASEPGVWHDGDVWQAWDFTDLDQTDMLMVTEHDLVRPRI
jgi:hypothetical protein